MLEFMQDRTVIGWREYVALPEWGASGIKAKVDTGARTSVIDVANLMELPGERARFDIVIERGPLGRLVTVITPIVRRTRVKSSFGASHDRLIVRTSLLLGPITKEVELSLVSRKGMICRMLLGRQTLEPDLLVDSSGWYLLGKPDGVAGREGRTGRKIGKSGRKRPKRPRDRDRSKDHR